MIRHGGLNWLCGARWTSVSDEAFIDSIKSHVGPLRRCYTGLLRSDGGREKERERDGEGMQRVKGLGEGVGGGVNWHTERPQCLCKSNMQTPAFRGINTVPQTTQEGPRRKASIDLELVLIEGADVSAVLGSRLLLFVSQAKLWQSHKGLIRSRRLVNVIVTLVTV